MTDRKPGAPGQYKMEITTEEIAKMHAGEQFTATILRDDQPITPGTPYSKATVLPDELAGQLCPGIEDPTPADALAALNANKAPGGYGLGTTAKTISTLEELNAATGNGWYRIVDSELTIAGWTTSNWWIHVSAYNKDYLVQRIFPLGAARTELIRWRYAGTWYEEWVNPPMIMGAAYRTTERWNNGKPVYTKAVQLGALPNAASKTVETGVSANKIIRAEIMATNGSYTVSFPYFLADGTMVCKHLFTGSNIQVTTATDYSAYTAWVRIWYTEE